MDITWITPQLALGGGIWNDEKMSKLAQMGVTHIINMQIEFDDRPLAEPYGISVLWNPTDDDFQPKSPDLLRHGVEFALDALQGYGSKLFIHCAAGVHRAPMMTLAVMGVVGYRLEEARGIIQNLRPVVDWAPVYVASVEEFIDDYTRATAAK
jgi:protein-tyrosine phosphatase